MGTIKLTESKFVVIPEGTHVFKITGVNYKESFGKLEVAMETEAGLKHTERFSLLSSDGTTNQGALGAFSYFAKTALGDYTVSEIDPEDIVGCFIECDVEHDVLPSKKDPNKTVTFARLTDKRPSKGWSKADTAPQKAVSIGADGKPKVDLKSILG